MWKVGAFLCVILSSIECREILAKESCESQYSCFANYEPICAFNGIFYKSFSNRCKLDVYNKCNDIKFIVKYNGECKTKRESNECSFACLHNYDPICAYNGIEHKTFPNECELMRTNCEQTEKVFKIKSNGECGQLEGLKCDHYCNLDYDPICGFNGLTHRTFTNNCYMERFNCLEDETFQHRFNGTCWNFEINCSFPCSKEYKPMCAYDGVLHKTFDNECTLKLYNCPRNFFIMVKKFEGECGHLFEGQKCHDLNCGPENFI